jgi:hypothetical protein
MNKELVANKIGTQNKSQNGRSEWDALCDNTP